MRIVIELRDRLDDVVEGDDGFSSQADEKTRARNDALAALEALGMSRNAADKSLKSVLSKHPDVSGADEMIRLSLRRD